MAAATPQAESFFEWRPVRRSNPDKGAPIAVTKTYDFVMWLLPKVESFPRTHKFTVGERLSASGLDQSTTIVEAAYSPSRSPLLEEANRKVNSTRYLLRLAKDLRPPNRTASEKQRAKRVRRKCFCSVGVRGAL